jgi:hypothetical protein
MPARIDVFRLLGSRLADRAEPQFLELPQGDNRS